MSLFHESKLGQIVIASVICIALIHNSILLVCHSYYTISSKISRTSTIQWLSLVSMLSMLVFIFSSTLNNLNIIPPSILDCEVMITFTGVSFVSSKISLYFFFLERLFSVFEDTKLEFKRNQKLMSRMLLSLWWITLTFEFIYVDIGEENESNPGECVEIANFVIAGTTILGDLVVCIIISILFSRRLLLAISLEGGQNAYTFVTTAGILRKSTLLTFITLITTQLSLVFGVVFNVALMSVSLDCMVNAWCVLLIFCAYKGLYSKLCGNCERMLTPQCLSCWSCTCCCPVAKTSPKVPKQPPKETEKESEQCPQIVVKPTKKITNGTRKECEQCPDIAKKTHKECEQCPEIVVQATEKNAS